MKAAYAAVLGLCALHIEAFKFNASLARSKDLPQCVGTLLTNGPNGDAWQCDSLSGLRGTEAEKKCQNSYDTDGEAYMQCVAHKASTTEFNCLAASPCKQPVEAWQLVMKVGSQTDKLGYSSELWTNAELLNPGSAVATEEDAKYDAYLNVKFKEIKMCVGSPDSNCVTHKFSTPYESAKALFNAGYIRDETVKKDEILSAFGPKPGSFQDCPMQRPGFNIQCKDNNWARWGFCLNCASQGCQNSDGNDADAAIGIGLRGQTTNPPEMGAGWTEYFASGAGTCSANSNSKTYKAVWIWVYGMPPPPPPPKDERPWQLVMKVGSQTDKLGYSSELWTNAELLNPGSAVATEEDAKYDAYLNVKFKEIKMCVGSPDSNCVTHKFSKNYESARALFNAGYIRDETVKKDEILSAFGPKPGSFQDCPMQRPGFNIQCKDNNWARWGFCLNCASQDCQNSDGNDADAAIGIGLRGQTTNPPEMGAGWTEYFASGAGTCSANSKTYKSVWIWVQGVPEYKCELGCSRCGYNWYHKQWKNGNPTKYYNQRCNCCGGTDTSWKEQQNVCKLACAGA